LTRPSGRDAGLISMPADDAIALVHPDGAARAPLDLMLCDCTVGGALAG